MVERKHKNLMARPKGKRADNNKELAEKLEKVRRLKASLRVSSREIAEKANCTMVSIDYLFSDSESAKRYHTELHIRRAEKALDKIRRDAIKRLNAEGENE